MFMEDISITHHLSSLSCVPVAQHKHHESQHQTIRSLWGAQTRRNQASWLIVDYHETVLVFPTSFFADLSIYDLGSKVAPSTKNKSGAVKSNF